MTTRVNSMLGNRLSNGGVCYTAGKSINTLFSNSILCNGSGTALVKEDFTIAYAVDKNLSEPFNLLMTRQGQTDLGQAKIDFLQAIKSEVDLLMTGKAIGPREPVLVIGDRVIIRNDNYAASVIVMGGGVSEDPIHEHILNITIKVKMVAEDAMVKMRRPFTKFTTTPSSNFSITGNQDFQIILNLECTKGQGSLVEMYCNSTEVPHYINMNTGILENSETGESIDLKSSDNAIKRWVDENAVVEQLTVQMAKSHYDSIIDVFWKQDGTLANGIVSITEINSTTVEVVEEIEVVAGRLVYDVEISTAREAVGTQELTLEQVANFSIQCPEIGAALINEATAKADRLINFAVALREFSSKKTNAKVIDLNDEDARYDFFVDAFQSMDAFRDMCVVNHRGVFNTLAKAYSNGIRFVSEHGETAPICFQAMAEFGHFSFNGSAAGECGQILAAISAFGVPELKPELANKLIESILRNYSKWIRNLAESPSALKKAARAGRMVGGKVRTTFDPIVHSEDGVPTVVLNKNCPIRKMLNLVDGDFVGIARTPMVSITVCRVKLTDKFNIAHVMIDPYVFHRGTEGDSDGDGCALLDIKGIKGVKMTVEMALAINNSVVGPGGYEAVWKVAPYFEFMSHDDKLGKKRIIGNDNAFAATTLGKLGAVNASMLGDYAVLVGSHYRIAVGNSYGMCSALTFDALSEIPYTNPIA